MKKYDKEWLKKEIAKDEREIDRYKQEIINSFRTIKKEQIFQDNKISIWKRIKRVLGL